MFILPCLDIFFLFSGGGHKDQNGISDYNVLKKKKKKKKKNGKDESEPLKEVKTNLHLQRLLQI